MYARPAPRVGELCGIDELRVRRIPNFPCGSYYFTGDEDDKGGRRDAETFAARLPNATLKIVEVGAIGAGLMCPARAAVRRPR